MGKYLKEAFLFRWNLLFFGGAIAAGFISGVPDVILPIVGAVELAYLAGLTSHDKFRAAIDAKIYALTHPASTPTAAPLLDVATLLSSLSSEARGRYKELQTRSEDLLRIAMGVQGQMSAEAPESLPGHASLQKMLGVFARLLFAKEALQRYLITTSEDALQKNHSALERRLQQAQKDGNDRLVKSLQESVATAELRLDNYKKSMGNYEFITAELDRVSNKVQALAEMAVGHQDPDFIARELDSAADSIAFTEETFRGMQPAVPVEMVTPAPPMLKN